jgi:uncharacterized protein YndB with AHSA1/START domain
MLKIILLVVAAVIVMVLIYVATRPDTFRIERRISIKTTPENIFPLINNFHQWHLWSPWEKMDATMNRTFSGTDAGVGTIYEWQGNKKVGKGRMEILESSPSSAIKIQLDFFEPFAAHNKTEFTFEAQGENTQVVWAMTGPNLFIGKVMSLFFNMDKLVGKDFETGLTNLKNHLEKPNPQ